MSIVWLNSDGWILCHSDYLHSLYKTLDDERTCPDCGKYDTFHIHSPFRRHQKNVFVSPPNITTTTNLSAESNEVIRVSTIFERLMNKAKQDGVNYFDRACSQMTAGTGNVTSITAANGILKAGVNSNSQHFHGENANNYAISVPFHENEYFIPPLCKFFCCPVQDFDEKLRNSYGACKFDAILLDPPWWNKHVRRKNATTPEAGYKMIYDEQLSTVPIDSLLGSDGLVVVWCTNSQQHIDHLLEKVFPTWKVEYICTWYWMKVTENGRPICRFTLKNGEKKPFERIIFGARKDRSEEFKMPEPDRLIVSIPSAIHSHKPPLASILSEYMSHDPRCLEVFARYLLPNWISTGDEVLKLQQKRIFVQEEKR